MKIDRGVRLGGVFLKRSSVAVAWVALMVSLWSFYTVKTTQQQENPSTSGPQGPPSSQAATALSTPEPPAGCSEDSAFVSNTRKEVRLDALPAGSAAWATAWSVYLDPAGRAYLPSDIRLVEASGGTATTRVVKEQSGAVSVIQCEPRPIPSDPDLYSGGVHLDVGGPGWQPVTLTVPACLTYQLRTQGVMQAEGCGTGTGAVSPQTGVTAPKYAVELQIRDMRPGTTGWTQPWSVVREQSGKYFIDPTFALDKTRYGNAELQITKSSDGSLAACLDHYKIGPQDDYHVKANLPIQAVQGAPCTSVVVPARR